MAASGLSLYHQLSLCTPGLLGFWFDHGPAEFRRGSWTVRSRPTTMCGGWIPFLVAATCRAQVDHRQWLFWRGRRPKHVERSSLYIARFSKPSRFCQMRWHFGGQETGAKTQECWPESMGQADIQRSCNLCITKNKTFTLNDVVAGKHKDRFVCQ
ncbi:hypothetical protein B0H14DRAFT_1022958 [Mycena olivaceomarginata]|nr:hypothetical protein B0H14DRAFT_1022958 [Mycena olivaceomarginata]